MAKRKNITNQTRVRIPAGARVKIHREIEIFELLGSASERDHLDVQASGFEEIPSTTVVRIIAARRLAVAA